MLKNEKNRRDLGILGIGAFVLTFKKILKKEKIENKITLSFCIYISAELEGSEGARSYL